MGRYIHKLEDTHVSQTRRPIDEVEEKGFDAVPAVGAIRTFSRTSTKSPPDNENGAPGVMLADDATRTGTIIDAPINNEEEDSPGVMVAVMGATGTGKSTFIKLLTGDSKIVIGHNPDSETSNIDTACYVDGKTGLSVTLIDTPGFDDSREGVSDVDILGKIAEFLQGEGGRKLNGIIYTHRISDPRLGGVSRKNLRMFEKLCGKDKLGNVRIVTTNWGRVGEEEGRDREAKLATGAFKPLIDAGARLVRQDNDLESAQAIMAELIPKPAVTIKIQKELNAGTALIDTGAGAVINEELKQLVEKHKKEMAALKEEMEEAARAQDEALRAELAEERRELEDKIARAEDDRVRLEQMVVEEKQKNEAERQRLEQERINMERKHAEIQAQLKESKQKNEAEIAKLQETAKKTEEHLKNAENESARLAAEMKSARAKELQDRAEFERRLREDDRKHQQRIEELHQKVDEGEKKAKAAAEAAANEAKAASRKKLEEERQEQLKRTNEALEAMQRKAEKAEERRRQAEEDRRRFEERREEEEQRRLEDQRRLENQIHLAEQRRLEDHRRLEERSSSKQVRKESGRFFGALRVFFS